MQRNVHVSLTQRATDDVRGGEQGASEVELCDRSLPARVCGLAVDALAVAFHLGQVLVKDLA